MQKEDTAKDGTANEMPDAGNRVEPLDDVLRHVEVESNSMHSMLTLCYESLSEAVSHIRGKENFDDVEVIYGIAETLDVLGGRTASLCDYIGAKSAHDYGNRGKAQDGTARMYGGIVPVYRIVFPIRLEYEMGRAGIDVDGLACDTGIPTSRVRGFLDGELEPDAVEMFGIGDRFGCSFDYLAGRTDNRTDVVIVNTCTGGHD